MNWIIHRLEILTRMHHKCDNIDVLPHCGRKVKRWWTRTDGRCYDTMNFPWDSMRLHFFSPHFQMTPDKLISVFSFPWLWYFSSLLCSVWMKVTDTRTRRAWKIFIENKTWWSHKKNWNKIFFFEFSLCSCSHNCSTMIFHRSSTTEYPQWKVCCSTVKNYNGKSFFSVNNLPCCRTLFLLFSLLLDSLLPRPSLLQAKSNFLIFYYSIMRLCFSVFINSQQKSWKFYSFFIVPPVSLSGRVS